MEITCRGCSLLCDDLTCTVSAGAEPLVQVECPQGQNWFQQAGVQTTSSDSFGKNGQISLPAALPDQTTQELLLAQAQELLDSARNPLFCGLQGLTLAAERQALELAEQSGGYVCLGSSPEKIQAGQRYGGAACTLGEVRHRADLVICGDVDPFSAWSRFDERFLSPAGRFLSGEKPRKVVFLGEAATPITASRYDRAIVLPTGTLTEAVQILRRQIAQQLPLSGSFSTSLPAEILAALQELAEEIRRAAYPVLLTPGGEAMEWEWTWLVQQTNEKSRLHRLTVSAGPAAGQPTETLLAWTGFPDAIHCIPEATHYDLQRYQPERLLATGSVDLCVYLGGVLSSRWCEWLQQARRNMPIILILEQGIPVPEELSGAVVVLRCSVAGIHSGGTMLRADGVPMPLRAFTESASPDWTTLVERLRLSTSHADSAAESTLKIC